MKASPRDHFYELLRDVSRSFYLTLRVLPAKVRRQIGLAYLLARTSDTIADTELVPVDQRLEALKAFRERLHGTRQQPLEFARLAECQASAAERSLLEKCEASLAMIGDFDPRDQGAITAVLSTITSGQELDLIRFAGASEREIVALRSRSELEDYTYRVAGCVGEFWTKICRAHLFPAAALDQEALTAQGVKFGKGLQLVNILRDLPKDLRQGRCYLPSLELEALGIKVRELLEPATATKVRPLYNGYLDEAGAGLRAGWEYTNTLPRKCVRVRLACAWPLLIGRQTLDRLKTANPLDANSRVKVPRRTVRSLILRSILYYPFPARWQRLFANSR